LSTTPTPRRRLSAAERRELIELAATEVVAERGYHGAAMSEIARRAGVSVPVVYDHFDSKLDLYERLLERHYTDLQRIWIEHLGSDEVTALRLGRAVDAWFRYVEAHPFASRVLFRSATGDPVTDALHREVAARSRDRLLPRLDEEPAVTATGRAPAATLLVWEVFRATMQGLALLWAEHPEIEREQLVATTMNALWIGYERVAGGETWSPPD
jgi:AcrR family transcriptional regulator